MLALITLHGRLGQTLRFAGSRRVKFGSLFSGIGGLELGLERAGLATSIAWQVENDAKCRDVLAKHWPHVDRSITDVRSATSRNLAHVDGVCGGFPCQDVSSAGLGAGLDGERSGLWREFRKNHRRNKPENRHRRKCRKRCAALVAPRAERLARAGFLDVCRYAFCLRLRSAPPPKTSVCHCCPPRAHQLTGPATMAIRTTGARSTRPRASPHSTRWHGGACSPRPRSRALTTRRARAPQVAMGSPR